MNTSRPNSERYVLYGGGVTRAVGPQMVLDEGNIDYVLHELDEHRGDHRHSDFLTLNPAGYIPALVTPEGPVLHEAAAIMLYVAERHDLSWLLPTTDGIQRGVFLSRLFFQTNDIQPAVRRFFKPDQYSNDPLHAASIKDRARDVAMDRWAVYNQFLETDGPFALGDQFSLADMHMVLWAAYGLDDPGTVTDSFPAVRRSFELTLSRPKIHSLVSKLQSDMHLWSREKNGL